VEGFFYFLSYSVCVIDGRKSVQSVECLAEQPSQLPHPLLPDCAIITRANMPSLPLPIHPPCSLYFYFSIFPVHRDTQGWWWLMYNRPRKSTLTECCEFPPPSPGISGPCRLFIVVVGMLRFTTTHPPPPWIHYYNNSSYSLLLGSSPLPLVWCVVLTSGSFHM
jgi:hypothetical protein